MDLLCTGCTMEQIGIKLGLRPGTIKFHLKRIYSKLDAVNGLHAVAIYTAKRMQPGDHSVVL